MSDRANQQPMGISRGARQVIDTLLSTPLRRHVAACTLGLTALVLVAIMSGVALASGPNAVPIHACANKRTGALRIIALGARCKTSERTMSWNTQGIQGATGPQGAPGDQGFQGIPGAPGAAGPGANETSYTLLLGQTEPLGTLGPFDFSAQCEAAGTEIAHDLNETNRSLVTIDETEMTPPSSIIVSPGAGIPPTTSASDPFETIASNSFAQRHDEDAVTSPTQDVGELILTMGVGVNDCTGSLLCIPAEVTPQQHRPQSREAPLRRVFRRPVSVSSI